MAVNTVFGFILIGIFICGTMGHSYVTSPTSRSNQRETRTGCRGPACLGPCERPASQARAPIVTQRGATLNIQWPRNNHAAGFIRFAWAPTTQSDSHAVFDSNVYGVWCHETGGCKPDDPSNPNGGDSNPGDGSYLPCQTDIHVPSHLTDGLWTLQWAWFGGAFALGDYYSCIDYQISGGNALSAQATPFFHGGDYSNPNQPVCKYFNTDRLHRCVQEPCDNPVYSLYTQRVGTPFGYDVAPSTTGKPSTTGVQTTGVQTTGVQTTGVQTTGPRTTGVQTTGPRTTGVQTTGVQTTGVQTTGVQTTGPRTTGVQTTGVQTTGVQTTGAEVPVSPPQDGNCAGASILSSSTATIKSVDAWGQTFRAVIEINFREASPSWFLEWRAPANMGASKIINWVNAGSLQCQTSSTPLSAVFAPVANWAKNQQSGNKLTVEITGTNPERLTPDQIKSNAQVLVYRS